MTVEPRTEAGRSLAALHPERNAMIVVAESEARAAALREVAEAGKKLDTVLAVIENADRIAASPDAE